jgi:type I restriction enzyme S subunit
VAEMNVPNGFKQTEVGVIPDDWEVKKLSDLSSMKSGEAITSKNIHNADKYPCFGGNGLRGYTSSYTHHGDFALIGRQGALCGNVQFVAGNFFASEHAVVVTPQERTDIKWLYYMLLAMNLNQYAESSAQPGLSVEKINKLPIPIPPTKPEQTAIAAALSDMDSLIDGVEKLLEKKRCIKQGAMQELLRPKEGWKEVLIGSIADILTGFPFSSSGYSNDGIKLLRGSNVKRGNIDWSKDNTKYWKCITNDIKNYELQAGDVVIAMDGSLVGKSFAQISEHDIPALLLQRVARIRTDKVDINYISHLVCGNYFTIHCEQIKTSSAIPHISPKDIRDFQIPLPPTRAEQAIIAAILSDMDTEIEQLETQLTKYRQLKTGMMQELLTGKKRLV